MLEVVGGEVVGRRCGIRLHKIYVVRGGPCIVSVHNSRRQRQRASVDGRNSPYETFV